MEKRGSGITMKITNKELLNIISINNDDMADSNDLSYWLYDNYNKLNYEQYKEIVQALINYIQTGSGQDIIAFVHDELYLYLD